MNKLSHPLYHCSEIELTEDQQKKLAIQELKVLTAQWVATLENIIKIIEQF